jgi:hypothetical protein
VALTVDPLGWRHGLTAAGIAVLFFSAILQLVMFASQFYRHSETRQAETDIDVRNTRDLVLSFTLASLVALTLFAFSNALPDAPPDARYAAWKGFARTLASGLLVSFAFFATGCFFGFIFGIPRSLHRPGKPPDSKPEPSNSAPTSADRYASNTNLEEISDWLTKIIVGVGLVELKRIPAALISLAHFFSFGETGQFGPNLILGIIVFFFVSGFFLAYLMTRLYLIGALARSELDQKERKFKREADSFERAARSLDRATAESADPRPVIRAQGRQSLRLAELSEELQNKDTSDAWAKIVSLAKEYDDIRDKLKPSRDRTAELERIAGVMRTWSDIGREFMPELTSSKTPGLRLAAVCFLEVRPEPAYLTWLADRFNPDEKPFLQYHAAVALRIAAERLDKSDRPKVDEAIKKGKKYLEDNHLTQTDRYEELQRAEELRD